jgi:RNA polymerase sigma factor (sigma-70 family)
MRDTEKADAYLKRAVVNGCRARIRKRTVEARFAPNIEQEELRRGSAWDPDRHVTQRTILEAVSRLPERQRTCVALRYFEDLTEREIADLLDCSIGTIKSQLSKARTKLEKTLRLSLGDER